MVRTIRVALITAFTVVFLAVVGCRNSPPEFRVVVIDAASKSPVTSARIVLARENADKLECTIDTSLTGVSDENGEVKLPNVKRGEYVVFYNLSGAIRDGLNGKVVSHHRVDSDDYLTTVGRSFGGSLRLLAATELSIVDGLASAANGYAYSADFDLAMICSKGKLVTIRVPGNGNAPARIEIGTALPQQEATAAGAIPSAASAGPAGGEAKKVRVSEGTPTVDGRLPPEIIRRIVRLNSGRFRLCYEDGLRRNPNLQGRATVKFVINRSGAIGTPTDRGSDIPDVGVVGCVVRAFGGLSFPQPEQGTVSVVYPIDFSLDS